MAYELPKYEVLKTDDKIEIRHYQSILSAEVTLEGDYKEIQNDAFRILAAYIFGDNQASSHGNAEKIAMTTPVTVEPISEKIAMTTPVTIEPQSVGTGKKWTMRFMMPSKYTKETLPKPKDSRIKIVEVAGYHALAYRFSWYFGKDDLEKYSAVLNAYAQKNNIKLEGLPFSAVYNSPFTLPFLRRNEVIWKFKSQ